MEGKSSGNKAGRLHYIFFAPTIGNIGGGQLYLSAKVGWLESIGWKVSVYYTDRQPVYLSNLQKFEKSFSEELQFRFTSYSQKERENIGRKLLGDYRKGDCVVVESYSPETALWGELVAEISGGKHFCYIIAERKIKLTQSQRRFFQFKCGQNLLYGITKTNIAMLLPGADGEATFLRAEGCSQHNAPYIDDERLKTIPEDGFTILSVGRLEKPYMPEMFQQVVEFSRNLPVPVNFVVVGDTSQKNVSEELFSILENSENIRLSFWGYAYPVPRQLYEKADVFVGCAGSANIAYKERVPTITIDAHDYKGIGILGETTENRLYRDEKQPPIEVKTLLEKIYSEAGQRRNMRKTLSPIVEDVDFGRHLEIINAPFDGKYYPVEKVRNSLWFDVVYNSLAKIMGKTILSKVKKIKQMIMPSK